MSDATEPTEPTNDAPFVPRTLGEWYEYLDTPQGRSRFPSRFSRRSSLDDSTKLDNYLRLKEPWRYEE